MQRESLTSKPPWPAGASHSSAACPETPARLICRSTTSLNSTLRDGDRLLEMVGQRLMAAVREVDTVARVGGDEFAIVLWQVNGALDAASVASKLLKTVSKQYGVRGRTAKIAVSAGVAIYPAHGDDAASLLKSADLALHEAKDSGKNAYRVFDGGPLQRRRDHLPAGRPFERVIGRIR